MRKFIAVSCFGMLLVWSTQVWPGGGGEGDTFVEDSIRAMNARIKELEDEVRRLRAAQQAPVPVAEPAPAPDLSPLENRLSLLEDGLGLLKGLEFGGMLYTSYAYNFNEPDSRDNSLRIFDTRHNNFNFDLFQLSVGKQTESGIGFQTVLDFGKTARGIASDWDGDGELSDSEETNDFEVQEAYLTYNVPVGKGLEVKAGKFVTLLGAEVIESPLNYNISRSFLFGFAIPFTHTGVLLSYPVHDRVSLTAGVVNGWDNVVDANDGKTFLGSLGLEPMDSLSVSFNGVFGPEQADRGGSKRGVFDTVLTYTPIDHLEFNLNYDRGTESNILDGGDEALWQGVAGIVSIGGALLNPQWEPFSLALRGEWFSDEDGTRTGTAQDLWEVTTTLKWQMTEHLQARVEYRHDESSKKSFEQDTYRRGDELIPRFQRGQDTIAAELAYLF